MDLTGRKLLCIVAHPDDECYAFGGALALASSGGAETRVVCLTDGQAATNRGTTASNEALGQARRAEFAASCQVLGVRHHEILDYGDAHLEFADFSHAASRLVERIRAFQPEVVLTFGLDGGMNTHPDHTLVSALTTAAVHWAASPKRFPQTGAPWQTARLFHVTTTFFLPNRPAPLPAPWSLALDIGSVFHLKLEAFRAHTTQAPLMEQTRDLFTSLPKIEHYTLMATPTPQPAAQLTTLFEAL